METKLSKTSYNIYFYFYFGKWPTLNTIYMNRIAIRSNYANYLKSGLPEIRNRCILV